jgi:hypothetical protein
MLKVVLAVSLCVSVTAISGEARARDPRPHDGFSTGSCKKSSCYEKHPSGEYVYPHHYGHKGRDY